MLRSQTKNPYVQTVQDKTCPCPDRPRWNIPISRLSCVRSKVFVRSPCVQMCVCPDFRASMSRPIASFIHKSCTQRFYNVFLSSIDNLGHFKLRKSFHLREPRLRYQTGSRYVQTEMKAQGGVVRSKLRGHETQMNARMSGHSQETKNKSV